METDGYTSTPADWAAWTTADPGGTALLREAGGGGAAGGGPPRGQGVAMPYSLSFQVSLTAFLMLELVLGVGSNLTVLALYWSQSSLVDSVSHMVTVNLHVLDVAVCLLCLPLTLAVVLLPPGPSLALLCCCHEACVTFAGVATAVNVLVVTFDRYDISVRPARRLLTARRAALLLAAVWVASAGAFLIPFVEVGFFSGDEEGGGKESRRLATRSSSSPSAPGIGTTTLAPAVCNRTLLCVGGQGYHTGLGMYYHLILQVPLFFTTAAVMLFTYSRILRALNIRIGSQMKKSQRFRASTSCRGRHKRRRRKATSGGEAGEERCTADGAKQLSHPPLIPSPSPTSPTEDMPLALSSSTLLVPSNAIPMLAVGIQGPDVGAAAATPVLSTVGVQASVSAIIALRRAVRRHRDRRERQRRVFRMSLLIISTFLGCWAPLSVTNVLILGVGPSDGLVSLRLWFLALAYGTTVSHPLLYAFTRQKLRRALRAKVKKRVVSLLQVDTSPGAAVIHNSWVDSRKGEQQVRLEASEATGHRMAKAL